MMSSSKRCEPPNPLSDPGRPSISPCQSRFTRQGVKGVRTYIISIFLVPLATCILQSIGFRKSPVFDYFRQRSVKRVIKARADKLLCPLVLSGQGRQSKSLVSWISRPDRLFFRVLKGDEGSAMYKETAPNQHQDQSYRLRCEDWRPQNI